MEPEQENFLVRLLLEAQGRPAHLQYLNARTGKGPGLSQGPAVRVRVDFIRRAPTVMFYVDECAACHDAGVCLFKGCTVDHDTALDTSFVTFRNLAGEAFVEQAQPRCVPSPPFFRRDAMTDCPERRDRLSNYR